MRTKLLISSLTILFSLISIQQIAIAHPWGGLVVDEDGNIYFTFTCPIVDEHHYACVWKLDTDGNLTQVLKSQTRHLILSLPVLLIIRFMQLSDQDNHPTTEIFFGD